MAALPVLDDISSLQHRLQEGEAVRQTERKKKKKKHYIAFNKRERDNYNTVFNSPSREPPLSAGSQGVGSGEEAGDSPPPSAALRS